MGDNREFVGTTHLHGDGEEVDLPDFLDSLNCGTKGGFKPNAGTSSSEVSTTSKLETLPYIMDGLVQLDERDLADSVKVHSFLTHQYRGGENGNNYFSAGGKNTGLGFHEHEESWNGLIYGKKRWYLYCLIFPLLEGKHS